MTEISVRDNTFFALELGDTKKLFDSEGEAVAALKKMVSNGEQIDPETANIYEVMMGEKWEINPVPWSKIALQLLKGSK